MQICGRPWSADKRVGALQVDRQFAIIRLSAEARLAARYQCTREGDVGAQGTRSYFTQVGSSVMSAG